MEKKFVNGFYQWIETYFEIVSAIVLKFDKDLEGTSKVDEIRDNEGIGGWYILAEKLTDEFEETYKNRQWDGDFFDTLEEFLEDKI